MLLNGLLITLFGMLSVFSFLYVLMLTIHLMSLFVRRTAVSSDTEQVAVAIAIALKQKGE